MFESLISFLPWIILILIVSLLLFLVFSYILGRVYPSIQNERGMQAKRMPPLDTNDQTLPTVRNHPGSSTVFETGMLEEEMDISTIEKQNDARKRLIYMFAIVMVIIIAASGGINAMTTQSPK